MPYTISRYFQNLQLRNIKGQMILNSWIKSESTDLTQDDDFYIIMEVNGRLDKIAKQYLGSEQYWWVICMLNDKKHFWDWKIGDSLRIPKNVSRFVAYIRNNINSN